MLCSLIWDHGRDLTRTVSDLWVCPISFAVLEAELLTILDAHIHRCPVAVGGRRTRPIDTACGRWLVAAVTERAQGQRHTPDAAAATAATATTTTVTTSNHALYQNFQ